jgi:hypothetical protein
MRKQRSVRPADGSGEPGYKFIDDGDVEPLGRCLKCRERGGTTGGHFATVVNMDAVPQVALRRDRATIHTRESSFERRSRWSRWDRYLTLTRPASSSNL